MIQVQQVDIYRRGVIHCSVCAPKKMSSKEVERQVNLQNPTGIKSKWSISPQKTFFDGTPNGGHFICSGVETRHWLMEC